VKNPTLDIIKADAVSYNMILGAYSRNGDVTQLKALFDCMHRRGVRPNAHTLSVVVNALAKSDDAECVGYSIGTAIRTGATPDRSCFLCA